MAQRHKRAFVTPPNKGESSARTTPEPTVKDVGMVDHLGEVILAPCPTHGIRVESTISAHPLPVNLLDGPTADLQMLGRFPLSHSLQPFHPDVLPLLLAQARPPSKQALTKL